MSPTSSPASWRLFVLRRAVRWAKLDRQKCRRSMPRFTRRPMKTDRMPIRSNTHCRYLQGLNPTVFGWV
jgi:hypothetical protein